MYVFNNDRLYMCSANPYVPDHLPHQPRNTICSSQGAVGFFMNTDVAEARSRKSTVCSGTASIEALEAYLELTTCTNEADVLDLTNT